MNSTELRRDCERRRESTPAADPASTGGKRAAGGDRLRLQDSGHGRCRQEVRMRRLLRTRTPPVRKSHEGRLRIAGRVATGTVKDDLHDIGKNLVASMLEGGGFEVHDLGAGVPPEEFVEAARSHKADSATLPPQCVIFGAMNPSRTSGCSPAMRLRHMRNCSPTTAG